MGLLHFFGKRDGRQAAAETPENVEAAPAEVPREPTEESQEPVEWPPVPRINPVRVAGNADRTEDILQDVVPKARKDEIGRMIFAERISPDAIRFLSLQELLFVMTAQEAFNARSPLPDFQTGHRALYNEMLNRVRDADVIYILHDIATGYPFIDHGYAALYLEEERAQAAARAFGQQFRKLKVHACDGPGKRPAADRDGLFDRLYYLGMERLSLDNGFYRGRFGRSEIVAPPNMTGAAAALPANPALCFAMIDFLSEARWPVKYEKRAQVLQSKELQMIRLARAARFIVPMQHEGPAEVTGDGRIRLPKDARLKFPVMKDGDGRTFLPVFTDEPEFRRRFGREGFAGGVFSLREALRFAQDKEGVCINPFGENIILPRERLGDIDAAAGGEKK